MKRKIVGIFVMTLLIATAVLPVGGMIKEYNKVENESAVMEFESTISNNFDMAIDSSDYTASDNLDVSVDPSDSGEITYMNSEYHIYEGVNWKLHVTACWDPPQEKQICLWVDYETLPAGATFPECTCGYGEVTSTLEWTPSVGQAGTYYITFYVGESCYETIGYFTVTVVVHPYEPDPQDTYEIYECHDWHLQLTAYWVPPNPEKLICLWVDTNSLPYGATFTECHCDYGEVTGDLYWHPQIGQAGEYIITFYYGEYCGYYLRIASIRVIVLPGCEDQNIEFYQIDFIIDETTTENSDWGSVALTFMGSDDIQYFNLAVNGIWQIQNIPVLSLKGSGIEQTQRFNFDLGNNVGDDVTEINYAYDITPNTRETAPSDSTNAPVSNFEVVLFGGGKDVVLQKVPKPAVPLIGGKAIKEQHKNENFPNQDCGPNECCPTAVSNSLQFLNQKHNLDMADKDITIDEMKKATNWDKDGAWIWHDDNRSKGQRNAWHEDKDAYMKKNGYPITTRKFDPKDIDKLIAEIDADQDIEVELAGHTACVVGITPLVDKNGKPTGKYSITIASDVNQNKKGKGGGAGEEGLETGIWNSKTGTWEGGFGGYGLNYFIVECPELPTWEFHFWYYDCPGGWLEVYGTHNCQRLYPPLFDDYIFSCEEYKGYIPNTIDGYKVNDIIFDFYWDYWCNNEEHIKFVNRDWNPYTEQWELNPIGDAIDEYVVNDLTIPSIGDPYGEIQDVYVVVDIGEFAADPRPPQDTYDISYGECDDLPGYLIGTTPLAFNPDAPPDENPFSTTLLTGVLHHDGEVTCSAKAEPPVAPTIDGSTNGKAGKEYDYTFVTTDPNEDEVYYYIEWGDGNIEEWIGPYDSGEEITLSHSWDEKGAYTTRVKAKDTDDLQSDWTTLEVSMPKNKAINTPFLTFLENHPRLFPLLQKLLGLEV